MRFNHARLARAAQALCLLLLLATLCAALAALWWGFELFVHFRVQYFIAALALGIALSVLRERRMALLAFGLGAVNAVAVLPMLFSAATAAGAVAAGRPLHVVSLNVLGPNRQYERVFNYVRQENPDVLVLLEITPAWGEALERLRGDFAYAWIRPTGLRAGMAVLSREQPTAVREIDLGGTGEPSLLVSIALEDGTSVSVLGTHLYWPLGPRVAEVRNRQLAAIARLADEHTGPLLVTGDLNITPFSPRFAAALREGRLRTCAAGSIEPTWPARMPLLFIQIDHCLAGGELSVEGFRVGPYVGSDHYPISMRVHAGAVAAQAVVHAGNETRHTPAAQPAGSQP